MQGYLCRYLEENIHKHLSTFPAVALLGARQVGKSTLAKKILESYPGSLYLDLEDPRDLAKLQDPLAFLEANHDKLICFDEVQRLPGIFTLFRPYLDKTNRPGQLLLLGSASQDLIRQSSESLAGRIAYLEVGPFSASEAGDFQKLWVQGGYPQSYFLDPEMSFEWRVNYIRTFLERDLPQLGFRIPAPNLRRFWTMLAHSHGSLLNQSTLAASMGLSVPTIKHYLDVLEGAFVIRRLPPFFTNTKKRLIKSPKVYIRDSGLVHTLLGITDFNGLLGHPILGASFESTVIESILQHYPRHEANFYRSSSGAEIDLILEKGNQRIAVEIKSSAAPKLSQGFYETLKIVQPQHAFVVASVKDSFPLNKDIWVHPLARFLEMKLN